ncbi:MAG: TrkA family potassium uptake protein [Halobacteriaceae archaeon]
MDTWQRRTLYSVGALAAIVLGYTVLYRAGMAAFEPGVESPPTVLHSLQVVVETFTTTGFGSDSPWRSPEMNLLVVAMNLTGVALVFLALPVIVFPLLEESLETGPPTTLDSEDHVLVCTYTPLADPLVSELESWEVPYTIVEPDRELATDLDEAGYEVVHADPESVEALGGVSAADARAVVADASDAVDASIVLAAREAAGDTPVYSLVDAPENVRYHRLAGAEEAFAPRTLVGEGLADKLTTSPGDIADAIEIGDDFEVAELPVSGNSDLAGTTLAESDLVAGTGVNVVGAWRRGNFETPPDPTEPIDRGTVLLVAGSEAAIEALSAHTRSRTHHHEHATVVVAGHGEVGQTITDALADAGVEYTVLDREPGEGVDVVGDATDADALRAAGVDEADAVVLALPDDTDTEFATLVAREVNPEVEILARAEEADDVAKTYRAGADYVIALATVSGRMVASAIIEEEEIVSFGRQVEIVRTAAAGLVGQTLGGADVRARTGCTVLAVERGDERHTDVGAGFRVEDGDELVVAGTDDGINRFNDLVN